MIGVKKQMEKEKKVSKVGNSWSLFLTDELKQIGVNVGESVQIVVENGRIVIVPSRKVELPEGISQDFLEVFNRNMNLHRDALMILKDK